MKHDNYEPALVKARKLAALADPASGASKGEIENAQRMLEAHCERHGITAEKLKASNRKRLGIVCISIHHKPTKDLDLSSIAAQILRFVVGENVNKIRDLYVEMVTILASPKSKKRVKVYRITAMVTELEHEEWRECFDHYAPEFVETRKKLRANQKLANRALKMARAAFVNQHSIFPPDVEKSDQESSLEEMLALRMAMGCVQGEAWERKSGKLTGDVLMLS